MKGVITNAAEITVLQPIDQNYKTGGGPVSVGGCVVVASKGRPFSPFEVFGGSSLQEKRLGKPLPKKAAGMEGLRHLADAAQECNWVNVIRVVNAQEYRFPSLAFQMFSGNNPNPVEAGTHRYNEKVLVGDDGYWMVLFPIDGDASAKRTVRIEDVDTVRRRFCIAIYDKDETEYEYLLERFLVGIGEDDVDDMGRPAYIETVFEQQSSLFRCDFFEGTTWEQLEPVLLALESTRTAPQSFAFTGGTSGGVPETQDWVQAVDMFRKESLPLNLLFAAGIQEPDVLARMVDVADERHCAFFFDVPPYLPYEQAMQWVKELGIKSRHARCYHAPFEANDPWRGGRTVWGVSGAMATAKARCNAIFTKNVPGVHYSPAGEKRGYLSRTGVKPLFPDDILNRDSYYDSRINPVIPMTSGGATPDDDLVLHYQQNYLRFGWINDVLDYIDHRFVEAASYAKFEPDGLTRAILYKLVRTILDELVTSGALVKPREPENDGYNEYTITIEQLEIDLWHVEWAVCITGAARRIAGQPRLIK